MMNAMTSRSSHIPEDSFSSLQTFSSLEQVKSQFITLLNKISNSSLTSPQLIDKIVAVTEQFQEFEKDEVFFELFPTEARDGHGLIDKMKQLVTTQHPQLVRVTITLLSWLCFPNTERTAHISRSGFLDTVITHSNPEHIPLTDLTFHCDLLLLFHQLISGVFGVNVSSRSSADQSVENEQAEISRLLLNPMQSYLTFIALECKEEQHRAIQRVFNRTAILLFSLCATFEWFIQFYHRVPFVFSLMRDMTTLEAEGYLFEHIHQLSTNLETWTRIDPIVFQTGRRVFLGVIQEGWEDFAEQQLLMASGGYRTAREGTVGKTVRDIWKIFGGNLS